MMQTAEWSIRHFKAFGLPRLIEDLAKLDRKGYGSEKCKAVKGALASMQQNANRATNSVWRPLMLSDINDFLIIYEKWNSRGEKTTLADRMHRRQRIDEMRDVVSKMGRAFKRVVANQRQMGTTDAQDHELASSLYSELSTLSLEHPETFPILRTAVRSYNRDLKRRSKGN